MKYALVVANYRFIIEQVSSALRSPASKLFNVPPLPRRRLYYKSWRYKREIYKSPPGNCWSKRSKWWSKWWSNWRSNWWSTGGVAWCAHTPEYPRKACGKGHKLGNSP